MSPLRKPIDWLRAKAEPRLFTIMHALLYPGVLGSLMYAVPDNLAKNPEAYDLWQIVLACSFFAMFVMDYTHSVSKPNEASYSRGNFAADFIIMVLMFVAGQRILGATLPPAVHPAWLLCAVKAAALAWESLKHPGGAANSGTTPARESTRAKETDFACMIIYALAAWLTPPAGTVSDIALAAALLVDAVVYLTYFRRETKAGGTA